MVAADGGCKHRAGSTGCAFLFGIMPCHDGALVLARLSGGWALVVSRPVTHLFLILVFAAAVPPATG